jgi:lipid A 4'-phosphatase
MSEGRLLLASSLLAALVFTLFPQIDLWASGGFYRPGDGFFLNLNPILQGLKQGTLWLMRAIALGLIVLGALAWFSHEGWLARHRKSVVYLMLVALIGPGLIVNGLLKEGWGRARPNEVQQFGGQRQFTPALVPASECDHNCSFSSGHAAAGFYLLSFGYVTRRRRKLWLGIGLAAGALLSAARVMQGGHFLSDVLFSGLITWATAYLVARWYLGQERRASN